VVVDGCGCYGKQEGGSGIAGRACGLVDVKGVVLGLGWVRSESQGSTTQGSTQPHCSACTAPMVVVTTVSCIPGGEIYRSWDP